MANKFEIGDLLYSRYFLEFYLILEINRDVYTRYRVLCIDAENTMKNYVDTFPKSELESSHYEVIG